MERDYLTFYWRGADRALVEEMIPLDILADASASEVPIQRTKRRARQYLMARADRQGRHVRLTYEASTAGRDVTRIDLDLGATEGGEGVDALVSFTAGRPRRLSIIPCPF